MASSATIPHQERFTIQPPVDPFPFACELSLEPLVTFWHQKMQREHPVEGVLVQHVHEVLRHTPALREPMSDVAVLAQHRELIDTLMQVIFPRASWEEIHAAALCPFQMRSFYATPSFARLFLSADGQLQGRTNVNEASRLQARVLYAYALILHRLYGMEVDFEYPLIYTATDPQTGLDCHFKVQWDTRFIEVRALSPVPPLTEARRQQLLSNLGDMSALRALLPPENFVFHGFMVLHAIEVTDQEVLSSLKRDLIERESLISTRRFDDLRDKLRTLFRRPALRFSLVACQAQQVFMLRGDSRMEHHCIYADSQHCTATELLGSVYERVLHQGETVLIDDLTTYNSGSNVEAELVRCGIRNLVIAPLRYQDTCIGALELSSPHPGDLHALNTLKLQEVLPLFAMAVQRSMDELDTRLQAVIKEQCTAIHPAVEWRFRQAAIRWMEGRRHGALMEMEPIVFEDVYPLYGVSDIRGSSIHRNAAIQADLVAHLRLAQEILQLGYAHHSLPLLTALNFHAGRHIARLEAGLGASDEVAVLDFLRRDVEPAFSYLRTCGAEVRERIERYCATLNPRLGTFYEQRKDFEESVMQLNESLAAYLDREEDQAQAMVPHYFEQHKSDGIEYGIYVGQSLLEYGDFDMVHVHNLRLWQLIITCGLARQAERIKPQLKVPLEVAHLILVQDMPLAVRFRFDEKRFDIDGAYNMRYEIVKKRIDKAFIKDSTERLTQPGTIAIVYAQPKEALEYRAYLEYLQATGDLVGDIEELELEDLPGAQGLKALRVSIEIQENGEAWEADTIGTTNVVGAF